MLFRDALEELKDRYLGRLSVFHVLSQEEQDIPVLNGRVDAERVRLLLRHIVPAARWTRSSSAARPGMLEAVEPVLAELGIAADRVHVERFVSAAGGDAAPPYGPADAPARHVASLIVDGNRRDVPWRTARRVLDAALRAGMDLPFACKGGMCSTCRARVIEGAVTMAVNYSLEPWEIAGRLRADLPGASDDAAGGRSTTTRFDLPGASVRGVLGWLLLLALAWAFSEHRRAIPWRLVIGGAASAVAAGAAADRRAASARRHPAAERGGRRACRRATDERHRVPVRLPRRRRAAVRGNQARRPA